MSHVTRVSDTSHTHEICRKPCHTCEWHVTHMKHVARRNESCHTCESVMSHVRGSHDTRMNASYVNDYICKWAHNAIPLYTSFTYVTWLIYICNHLHMWCAHLHMHNAIPLYTYVTQVSMHYGVALVSRIDKTIGLFCKRALQTRQYSAKETYNFINPTDCSHPIPI